MELSILTANQTGQIRYAKLGGRDYIVAPLSMLVPGVLPGSKGPLFYPPDVVNRNPSAWNNIPIVVNHPMGLEGPTSARDPDIINKQGIGFVFKARKDGRAEGWFDVENTKRIEPRIYKSLITNTPIELSTGLFTKHKKATAGSHYKGKQFSGIITNLEPDHLAILMDQTGACSLKDGCGVLINQEGKMPSLLERLAKLFVANDNSSESPSMRKAYKRKKYEGAETEENFDENDEADEFPIANEETELTLDEDEIVELVANGWVTTRSGTHIFIGSGGQITKGPKGLKGKSIPGGGSAKGDKEESDTKSPAKTAQPAHPLQQQMEHHLGKQQETALAAIAAQKAGNKGLAKQLASQSESHANEIHVLKSKIDDLKPNMGAKTKISSNDVAEAAARALKDKRENGIPLPSPRELLDKLRGKITQNTETLEGSQFGKPQFTKGEPNMAKAKKIVVNEDIELEEDEREELVESIIGNCNCHEDDKLVLMSLSDSTLATLAAKGITNNAIPPQFMKKKKAVPVADDASEDETDGGDDEEAEGEAPVAKKKQMVANSKAKPAKKALTVNSQDPDANLTPRQKILINYAESQMEKEKEDLIEKLTANAEEEDIEELETVYNSMEIPQLKLLAKALPKENKQVAQQPIINRRVDARQAVQNQRNFAGASGAVLPTNQQRKALTQNGRGKAEEPDFDDMPLDVPTINHAEIAGFENGRFKTLN